MEKRGGKEMIEPTFPETCFNQHCNQKLRNGHNIGGFKATHTKNGYKTGYTCKKCSNQSTPTTTKLSLWQQTHHYHDHYNTTNSEIKHKRAWQKLTQSLHDNEPTPNTGKTPTWNQLLDKIEQKRKEAKA